MFEYNKTLITEKIWQYLSFDEFFSSWKGVDLLWNLKQLK